MRKLGLGIGALIGATSVFWWVAGIQTKIDPAPFPFLEMGEEAHRSISAYQEVCAHAERIPIEMDLQDPIVVNEVKQIWLAQYRAGRLRAPVQTAFEDTSREGARQQIVTLRNRLAFAVSALARQAHAEGDYDEAIQLWKETFELYEIFKDSDLPSYTGSVAYQNSILNRLEKVSPESLQTLRNKFPSSGDWGSQRARVASLISHAAAYERDENRGASQRDLSQLVALIKHMPFQPESYEALRKQMIRATRRAPSLGVTSRLALERTWEQTRRLGSPASQPSGVLVSRM